MRRKECERDAAFAWEVLKNSIYSTVSMVCPDGTPYATPVNIIGDEVYNALYFHCAGAGERWELLKNGAPVCVTAVSTATLLPNQFTTAYRCAPPLTPRVWGASIRPWRTAPRRSSKSCRRSSPARSTRCIRSRPRPTPAIRDFLSHHTKSCPGQWSGQLFV